MTAILRMVAGMVGAALAFLLWAALIVLGTMASQANASPQLSVFVEYGHRSDLFTEAPFFSTRPGREPTEDMIAAGLELSWRSGWTLAVSQGAYARECTLTHRCDWQSGTRIAVRRGWVIVK